MCKALTLHPENPDSVIMLNLDAPNLEALEGVRVSKQKCQIPTAQTGSQAL